MESTQKTVVKESTLKTPNTIIARRKERTPWQRLTLSVFGILILLGIWAWAVMYLYSLPQYAVTSFTTITVNVFYSISAIVIFMISGKMIYDWKNQTTTSLVSEAKSLSEDKTEHTEHVNIEEQFQTPELEKKYANR